MKKLVLVALVVLMAMPFGATGQGGLAEYFELTNLCERLDGGYFTIIDPQGNVLMRTARFVHVGDTWIGADNRKWEVYQVAGDDAWAREVGRDSGWLHSLQSLLTGLWPGTRPVQTNGHVNNRVGVYHTHGAEAYVPSDGTESDPAGGGILQVAQALSQALEQRGVEVAYSDETHVPHDSGAYKRSRNTKEELIKEGVDAVIDVHRDAVPAQEYIAQVDGREMVQIQLVVGRQNQNQATIQQFAEDLKHVADQKYPGLIKGIFSAQGNYNQDMTPNSILIEVGTHENDREAAAQSATLFADVLTTYLYGTSAGQERAADAVPGGSTILRSILWLLVLVVVGGGIFLYISAGSLPEMKRKLQGFARGEFGDLFKLRVKNRDDRNK